MVSLSATSSTIRLSTNGSTCTAARGGFSPSIAGGGTSVAGSCISSSGDERSRPGPALVNASLPQVLVGEDHDNCPRRPRSGADEACSRRRGAQVVARERGPRDPPAGRHRRRSTAAAPGRRRGRCRRRRWGRATIPNSKRSGWAATAFPRVVRPHHPPFQAPQTRHRCRDALISSKQVKPPASSTERATLRGATPAAMLRASTGARPAGRDSSIPSWWRRSGATGSWWSRSARRRARRLRRRRHRGGARTQRRRRSCRWRRRADTSSRSSSA